MKRTNQGAEILRRVAGYTGNFIPQTTKTTEWNGFAKRLHRGEACQFCLLGKKGQGVSFFWDPATSLLSVEAINREENLVPVNPDLVTGEINPDDPKVKIYDLSNV